MTTMRSGPGRRPAWVTPAEVLRTLRKRWETGAFLTRFASGQPWQPLGLAIRGPAAAELAASFADAQAWARDWASAGRGLLRVERKQVGGRAIGVNSIPCRAWIDSYEQLWQLLEVEAEVARFAAALDQAKAMRPALADWMIAHPVKVLALAHDWDRVLGTVEWIDQHTGSGVYLRQIDVPGVDTKFIERHRGILTDLLDSQLPVGRIDASVPRADFAGRYRFRKKPAYVRFRYLDAGPAQLSELTVRATEMPTAPPGVGTVYVVENEITYLAFPKVKHAIAIFGGGYAVPVLEGLSWLAGGQLVYWGDLDTHGLEILARLRRRFPHTRSMLMDRTTLLAHQAQWVTEPTQARPDTSRLTADEAQLAHDLATDRYGSAVRLEQERIRFSLVEAALGSGSANWS